MAIGQPILPIFIWDPDQLRHSGAASRWWLHHALHDLNRQLQEKSSALLVFQGPTMDVMNQLVSLLPIGSIFYNRCNEPAERALEDQLHQALMENGITLHGSLGHLLYDPSLI